MAARVAPQKKAMTPHDVRQAILPELVALLKHQKRPPLRFRRKPSIVLELIDRVRAEGNLPEHAPGPWRAAKLPLKSARRGGLRFIPVAQRGNTSIMADSMERAIELASFFNWCDVPELPG